MLSRAEWKAQNGGSDDGYDQYKKDYTDQQISDYYGTVGSEESMEAEDPGMDMAAIVNAYKEISGMNWDKLTKEIWPSSLAAGEEAAGKTNEYLAQWTSKANQQDWDITMQSNDKLAKLMTLANQFYRGEADISDQWAYGRAAKTDQYMQGQVSEANQFNADQLSDMFNKVMPGLMDTAKNVNAKVDEMLSGELPADVQEQIQKVSAQMQLSGGLYGPAGSAATAKSLGLTSLDLTKQGIQYGMMLPSMAKELLPQQLLATPTQPGLVANPTQFYDAYKPTPTYTKYASDPYNYASGFLSAATGSTLMTPSNAISAAQNSQQMAIQNNQFNSELKYSYGMSNLQNAWSMQNWQTSWDMFDQQMSTQKQQSWMNLLGSGLGAAAGLGAGFFKPGTAGGTNTGYGNYMSQNQNFNVPNFSLSGVY